MTESSEVRPTCHDVIQHGNAHFTAGRYVDALAAFERALVMVDRLLVGCRVDVALFISKIVTQYNRAATLVRLQRHPDADAAYQQGLAFAQAIVQERAFAENLRQAARCHYRMLLNEWQVFRCEHGHRLDETPESFFAATFERSGTLATATVH
ncbi:MAG: tetratricopeptide repeat protein [Gammaproteobacteria bacterium]|nr:MAG: tetratricopeptide repeat protein [Gammaproteobacteria bacterium]